MFREFKNVRQEPCGHRRWFEGSDIELIAWYDKAGGLTGFQLLYQCGGEHALTWRRGSGFSHSRVDAGESCGMSKQTPILIANGAVPWERVESLFLQHAESLDADLRALVHDRLKQRN